METPEIEAGLSRIFLGQMGFTDREVTAIHELAATLDLPVIGVLKRGLRILDAVVRGTVKLEATSDSPGCGELA